MGRGQRAPYKFGMGPLEGLIRPCILEYTLTSTSCYQLNLSVPNIRLGPVSKICCSNLVILLLLSVSEAGSLIQGM